MAVSRGAVILIDADNVLLASSLATVRIHDLIRGLLQEFVPVETLIIAVSPKFASTVRQDLLGLVDAAPSIELIVDARPEVALLELGHALIEVAERLILVSADGFFRPLLQAAEATGRPTVVVSPLALPQAALSVVASRVLSASEIVLPEVGLVAPGKGDEALFAVRTRFEVANSRIVVLDPYTNETTIRLMAVGARKARLILVAGRLSPEARTEARQVIEAGASFSVFQSRDLHDRWFAVDSVWFHSGGSLKDLGRKWSRIARVDDPQEAIQTEQMLAELTTPEKEVSLH